jgi:prolyl-tRNA editing enzyme YbaK/EbsC (Cys-tRNA(Pro) deacylase)
MELDEIWAAAGTPNAVFCIKSQDLLKATGGNLINIKE